MLAYTRGDVPDYQLAAFLMAVYFRGLSTAETFALTDAMVRSGETIDLGAALGRRVVDKHSTGGVGDKTTLAVGPIVAACGVPFGKMSGRGLGHTGGTLDKLESIPGFRVELTTDEFVAQVREIGLAIVGQTANLVPADKMLYALRDVTATVDNVSLIAASIMSKKIASGADAIVLDVKVGDGAFMKSLSDAQVLGEAMLALGRRAGPRRRLRAHRHGPAARLRRRQRARGARGGRDAARRRVRPTSASSSSMPAAHLLALCPTSASTAQKRAGSRSRRVADGSAMAAYERWVRAQGGDPDEAALPTAPLIHEVRAPRAGYVGRLAALPVGLAALHLGAGRREKDDPVDHAVGVVCRAKRGDAVAEGDVLAEVHARDERAAVEAAADVLEAYELGDEPPRARPIVLDTLV